MTGAPALRRPDDARPPCWSRPCPTSGAFAGKVVVVKYGGQRAGRHGRRRARPSALASFAEDVVLLRSVGLLPVVVHGGGPQIGELMGRLGKEAEFRDGLRVTDAETLDIARMVLVGKVNRDIVSAINVHGPLAVGLSGEDANLITAAARAASSATWATWSRSTRPSCSRLLAEGLIPVVATIGADAAGPGLQHQRRHGGRGGGRAPWGPRS